MSRFVNKFRCAEKCAEFKENRDTFLQIILSLLFCVTFLAKIVTLLVTRAVHDYRHENLIFRDTFRETARAGTGPKEPRPDTNIAHMP